MMEEVINLGGRKYQVVYPDKKTISGYEDAYKVDLNKIPELEEIKAKIEVARKKYMEYLHLKNQFEGICALLLCLLEENERLRKEVEDFMECDYDDRDGNECQYCKGTAIVSGFTCGHCHGTGKMGEINHRIPKKKYTVKTRYKWQPTPPEEG